MTYPSPSALIPVFGLNWPLAYTDPMNHLLSPLMSDRWLELTPRKVMVTNEGSFHTSGSHCEIYHSFINIMMTVCVHWQPSKRTERQWHDLMLWAYCITEETALGAVVSVIEVRWSFITDWWKKSNTVCVTVCVCVCQRGQEGPWVEWCTLTETG